PGVADPSLVLGRTVLSVDQIREGGFDSLMLNASDILEFRGDVALTMGRSLTISSAAISAASETPAAKVSLAAPYVRIEGWTAPDGNIALASGGYYAGLNTVKSAGFTYDPASSIRVSASLLDITNGEVRFGVFGHQGVGYFRPGFLDQDLASPEIPGGGG